MSKKTGDWYCASCCQPFETGEITIRFGKASEPYHFKCVYVSASAETRSLLRQMVGGAIFTDTWEDE